jgi:transposase
VDQSRLIEATLPPRWLGARATHPTSIRVSREHRRVKRDRLGAGLLVRAVLGWL